MCQVLFGAVDQFLCCCYNRHSTVNMQVRMDTVRGTCKHRFHSYSPHKATITDAYARKHHGRGQKGHGAARSTMTTMGVPTQIRRIRKIQVRWNK
jgi:hypothetical protein